MAKIWIISPRGYKQECSVCEEKALITAEWTNKGPTGMYQNIHLCLTHANELMSGLALHTQDHGTEGWTYG